MSHITRNGGEPNVTAIACRLQITDRNEINTDVVFARKLGFLRISETR